MMKQMRENTKWIMLVTAAAFVALMVFEWGMDASGGAFGMRDVGRVGGTSVSVEQYQATYRNVYDQVQQSQDQPITSQQNQQIEDMAWDEVVTQILIEQELDRRGIEVTDEEIRRAARFNPPPQLRNDPAFQTDGEFDLDKYHEFLASASQDRVFLQQLEQYYREVIPRNKLMRQLTAGLYVPDSQLWREWKEQNEQVRVRYLALDPQARVPASEIEVSRSEIEAYYEENRDDFAVPAQGQVRYVTLPKVAQPADSAAARERAEEIRQWILDGDDFADVARQESREEATAAEGGDLGTITRSEGAVPAALEEAIFSRPVGEVGEPVETSDGLHIVEVLSREGDEAEARHIFVPFERTDESEFRLLNRADSLEALGEERTLEEAAREMGLEVAEGTLSEDFPILPGVGQAEEGAHWIFEEMVAPGAVSPVFETGDAFYMMELVSYSAAGHRSLDEVADEIRTRLTLEKQIERTIEEARAFTEAVRSGEAALEEIAEREEGVAVAEPEPFTRLDFVPGLGTENRAIGTAFGLDEGEVSRPVRSNDAVFILEAVERIPADEEEWEEQKDIQRAQVLNQMRQERLDRWIESLRENVRIEDRRAELFEMQEELGDQGQQMPMPGMF